MQRISRAHCYLTILFCGIAGAGSLRAQEASPETLSICDLFKNLRSYAGKTVSVRGLMYRGMEIFAIGGSCDSKFITKYQTLPTLPGTPEVFSEYIWPTAVNLADSSNNPRGEAPALFVTDKDSMTRAFAEIDRQRAILPKVAGTELAKYYSDVDVYVTVTGMLRMRDRYDIGRSPSGPMMGGGYGHLSIYPAELVIKSISDPVVRPKKPAENREKPGQ